MRSSSLSTGSNKLYSYILKLCSRYMKSRLACITINKYYRSSPAQKRRRNPQLLVLTRENINIRTIMCKEKSTALNLQSHLRYCLADRDINIREIEQILQKLFHTKTKAKDSIARSIQAKQPACKNTKLLL